MHDSDQDGGAPREHRRVASANGTTSPLTATGEQLIRRAPTGYLWNQANALWLFVSLLLFEIVVRRSLPQSETNVFDLVSTAANLGFYIASLGLASAGIVYLPRALAEGGPAQALALAIRLVLTRVGMALLVAVVILWGLPALFDIANASGWAPSIALSQSFTVRALITHRAVIAAYVVGVGISTLLSSLLVALVRTRIVFIIGSLSQLALLILAYVLVHTLRAGVDGALLAQALPPAVSVIFFAIALRHVLRGRPDASGGRFLVPAVKLGVASWLADLPNNSMVQPVALGQLAAVAPSELLFFKSTYQMGDAGARFFTDGLGGVSMAIMSASYAGKRLQPLATGWRTVNKLQVLLAIPLVAFCVPHAGAIMAALYGSLYARSGTLFAVFLILNGLTQILGGATHEWALYVLGRQQWVVVSRWLTLGVVAATGIVLVPRVQSAGVPLGAALGTLLAVGIGRLVAQIMLLVLARIWVRRAYPVAFIGKLLLTLVLPVLVTTLWRPTSFVLLVVAGALFLLIFLACGWVVRPLDADDAALLTQVPAWLRAALAPFVAKTRPIKPSTPLPPFGTGQPAAATSGVLSGPLPHDAGSAGER